MQKDKAVHSRPGRSETRSLPQELEVTSVLSAPSAFSAVPEEPLARSGIQDCTDKGSAVEAVHSRPSRSETRSLPQELEVTSVLSAPSAFSAVPKEPLALRAVGEEPLAISTGTRDCSAKSSAVEENLRLCIVRHPFRRDLRELAEVPRAPGESLLDLRRKHFPEEVPVHIYLNGMLIPVEKWAVTRPDPGDYVVFAAALSGGSDGKGIFRSIFMLIIAVAVPYLLPATLPAWAIAGITGAAMLVGGLIMNALMPPQTPKPASESAALDSQTYSWAPTNTQQQGVPVAKWYGRHKIHGNIICSYVENIDKLQIMHSLVNLGLGPIKSLANFKLNDQPYQNFKQVTIRTRYGYLDQTPIPNFQSIKIEYPASVEVLTGSPYIYQTTGEDFDAIEVDIAFPGGIWMTNPQSRGLLSNAVDIAIEVRKAGASTWKSIVVQPPTSVNDVYTRFGNGAGCSSPRWSLGKHVEIYDDAYGAKTYWWDYLAGSGSFAAHLEGEEEGPHFTWHWLGPVPAEYREGNDPANLVETAVSIQAGTEISYARLRDATASPLHYTFYYPISDEDRGRQQVRIRRMSVNSNSITTGGRSYFAGVREVIREKLQYPRQVLVSIRARATDQLSGSMRFSCVGDMAIVQVWDGFTHEGERPVRTDGLSTTVTTDCDAFDSLRPGDEIIANGLHRRVVEKVSANRVVVHQAVDWSGGAGCSFRWRHFSLDWSDNPAWVAYDIFTQPVIAGEGITASPFAIVRFDGIDPSRMDLPRFKEWADYCDDPVPDGSGGTEKRITFNGGFDFDTSLWEAGLRVCQVGRAVPVWNGVHLTLAIDKPSDPVNLYTVGNIEESRFKEIFLPMEERATQIEIDYVNRENDFQRDKLTVCRTDSANPYRANIDLFGITKPSQAWRAGMYRLNCNKYLVRSAEIDVDIEALNAQIGDVVSIQHDVPRWGAGGRLLGADADTVVLDREVTIEEGLAYKLLVRLAEDVVHEREVLNAAGAHSVLIVSPAFDTSADFDPATEYHQDDTVRYEGRIYRCVRQTPVPSPPPADTSYWYSTDSCPLPEKHDLYAFGQMDKHARRFRITDITRSQDQKITLCMIEYRPEVYESENCDPGLNDYTQTLLKRMEPQNVKLTEGICFGPAGIPIYSISIAFTQSSDATYKHAEIWYALVNGTDQLGWNWLYVGASAGTSFEIRGVDLSRTYAVILIPVDVSGRKLHHAHAAVHQISISIGAGRSGSQVRYPDSPGGANLLTSGLSVTVTTTEDAFEFVQVSDRIIADSEVRTVIEKLSSNEVLVDEPVDWSNEGAGYPFTYDAPLTALRPAEQGATEGAVIGENLRGSDGRTIITDSRIYGPDLPAIDPGTAGLYTVQDYLGYWDGSEWKVFISRAGSFLFKGDNDNFIQWNGSALSVRGSINAQDISAGTIHADRISAGTITTSKIEDGACTAKAQETASSYTGAASGQFNEALSVVLTVTVGAWILLHAECQSSARTQLIRTSNLNGQIQNAILIDKASGGFNTTTLDTPGGGSGTVTYRIYVHGQNSVTSLQISAIELRR